MSFSIIIRRRDMKDEECLICSEGLYVVSFFAEDDQLECPLCLDTIPRWMTKREVLEHGNSNS